MGESFHLSNLNKNIFLQLHCIVIVDMLVQMFRFVFEAASYMFWCLNLCKFMVLFERSEHFG